MLNAAPAFALERTECLGRCSAYRVTIDGDGRVEWDGRAHVAARGVRRSVIPRASVEALSAAAARARFAERDAQGRLPIAEPTIVRDGHTTTYAFRDEVICADTSRAIVSVVQAGVAHTVEDDGCTDLDPERAGLRELARAIDDVAGTAAWIGAPGR